MADDRQHDIKLIRRYLDGQLDARAMHELEYRAQTDPLLADLLQGMEQGNEPDHTANLAAIDRLLAVRVRHHDKKRVVPVWKWAAVAACLFIFIGVGSFWMLHNENVKQLAGSKQPAQEAVPHQTNPGKGTAKDTVHNLFPNVTAQDDQRIVDKKETPVRAYPKKEIFARNKKNRLSADHKTITGKIRTVYVVDNVAVTDSFFRSLKSSDIKGLYVATDTQTRRRFGVLGNESLVIARTTDTSTALSEVVVVGYATQKRKSVMGSISSVSSSQEMENEDTKYEYTPARPGVGWYEYSQYLKHNAILPTQETGVVKLRFVVLAGGYISNITVVKHLSEEADKKAIDLVRIGPSWIGNKDGKPEKVSLRIRFRKGK